MGNSGSSNNSNGSPAGRKSREEKKGKQDGHPQFNHEEGKESKIDDKIKEQNERREKLFNDVKKSLKDDKSPANKVYNYALLRAECPPKFECVGVAVEQMKEGWTGILKQLETIKQYSKEGKAKAAKMMNIYQDYWELLLETRKKITLLIDSCETQKINIEELLDIIEDAHKAGKGSAPREDDILAYDHGMKMLGKWVNASSIKPLIEKWRLMNKRLSNEKDDWCELAKAASGYYFKKTAWFIAKVVFGTIVALGVIAGVAAIVIATCGTAAVVGGAVAGTAVAVEAAAGVSTAAVVATAVAVGSVVAVGSTVYGVKKAMDFRQQAAQLENDINGVITDLEKMMQSSKEMQNELSRVEESKDVIGQQLKSYADAPAYRRMKTGLKRLNTSLDKFIGEGNSAMNKIDEAVKEFLRPRS